MRIPRIGLIAAMLGLSASTVPAQMHTTFGLQGGVTLAKFGGADAAAFEFTKNRVGFAAGGFVALGISPYFTIQPEAMYVVKGGKAEQNGSSAKVKLSYFEVPVLAKLTVPTKGGSRVSPHFYAGPAIAFKVGCTISGSDGSTTISGNCDDNDAQAKSTDLSMVFGGGLTIRNAIIDVRYDLGLTKVDDSGNGQDVKNRTLYFLVGWQFRTPK